MVPGLGEFFFTKTLFLFGFKGIKFKQGITFFKNKCYLLTHEHLKINRSFLYKIQKLLTNM